MVNIIKGITTALSIVLSILFGYIIYLNYNLPNNLNTIKGDSLAYKIENKPGISIVPDMNELDSVSANVAENISSYNANIVLFDSISIKSVEIDIIENRKLCVGGTPFGLKLLTNGILVVGQNDIETSYGTKNPSTEAGIKIGDSILSLNGQKVTTNEELAKIVEQSEGNEILANVARKELTFEATIKPVKSIDDGQYKIGMWIRDSSAGIGTTTYCDPETGAFGGLGHPISDVDTGDILPIDSGEIVPATITGINKGQNGYPGDLKGSFIKTLPTGRILANLETGVFGKLYEIPTDQNLIDIKTRSQITQGPAQILATIDGQTPKLYDVVIEKINYTDANPSKNMIIKITDETLLEKTGGIVQGMSGSPIIQDNKLVGALTHVFVNNHERGYGIFIENMLKSGDGLLGSNLEKVS